MTSCECATLRDEVSRLKVALLQYGVHRHYCASILLPPIGVTRRNCDCGLDVARTPTTEKQ